MVKDIPNLFDDFYLFNDFPNEKIVEILSSFPYIHTKYTTVCGTRPLCRVPRTFIQSIGLEDWVATSPQFALSEDDTSVIVGTETTYQQYVTTRNLYKFYFQHPAATQCEKDTECGFILKVRYSLLKS